MKNRTIQKLSVIFLSVVLLIALVGCDSEPPKNPITQTDFSTAITTLLGTTNPNYTSGTVSISASAVKLTASLTINSSDADLTFHVPVIDEDFSTKIPKEIFTQSLLSSIQSNLSDIGSISGVSFFESEGNYGIDVSLTELFQTINESAYNNFPFSGNASIIFDSYGCVKSIKCSLTANSGIQKIDDLISNLSIKVSFDLSNN